MKKFNFFEKLWEHGRTLKRVGLVLVMCLITIPQMWAGAKGFNDNGQWNIRYYRYGASDDWGAASGGYGNGGYIDLGVQTTLELHECWVKTWSNGGDKQKEVCWYYGWTNETMYYGGKATKDSWVEGNQTWNITTTYDMIYWAPNKPGNNTLYMYWRLDDAVSSSTSQIRFVYPGFTGAPSSKDFGSKNVINKDNETTISFTHYGTALTTTCTSEITGDDASMFYVRKIEDGQVTVVFKPTSTGTKTATLTLTDAHGMTCSIDLTGSGVALGTTTRLYFNDYTNHGDWSAYDAGYRVTCQYTSGVYTNFPMTLCDNSTYTYYADVELKDGTISKTIDRYNPSSPYVTWNSSNSLSLSSSNPYAISNGKYTAYVANHPFNSTAANLTFYYDNSDSKFTNSLYVIIGRDYVMSTGASGCWSTGYGAMSNVSNTKLYYRTGASALGAWPDATYYAVVGASSAPGNSEWGSSSLSSKGNGGYTNAYTETYDLKSGHYYLAYAPSKTNSAMTITDLGGYAALNCSITIAAKVKPVGGAYTAGATKGALSGSTMKFSSATSCGSSSSASVSVGSTSSVLVAGYTCTKCTLSVSSVADGYTFRGWYDASGTKLSESTSYTGYLPKGDATVYAYFEEDTYTITYNNMTGATNPVGNPSSYSVTSDDIILLTPTKSGYGFGGWYSDEDCTTRVKTIAQGSYGSKVLYAKWLTPHEPGYYVSNSPGYNVTLTTYSSLKYELYRYAVSSPNYFLCAGETPTTSDVSYNFLNGNKTGSTYHWDANSWIGHTNVYNVSSSSLSAKNEFPEKTAGTLYCRDQQGLVICIKGYKQFSYWGEDASNDSKNEKQFKVYFNGVDSTKGRDDADGGTIRRYTLDSTKTYVIEILGNTDNNNFLYGFSMRPGRPKITSSSLSGAEYAQGASATPLSVTATKLVSSGTTLSYQWYSNTTASNTGGTIIDGATSASYTPLTTTAGTTYYYCVVSETGCNSTTSSVSGAIIVTAACSATAPGSISKGSASGGTGIITLTAAGDPATNNTWYWQSSASGEDKSTSGNTKNVNAAGTYYLRSYCSDNGGCWSDAVYVEVSTEDLLTTPTATFSNGAYTIGSSALDLSSLWSSDSKGSVTYTVQNANGTEATISTAAFTATTAGTATVRASQAADGNYSAIYKDATITVSNPTYSVTYKANNSTEESDVVEDAESTFGDNPTFTAPSTKAFAGWNTKADGSGTHYDVGDAVPSAITVYAEWWYKVYYIASSTSESNDITAALEDAKFAVSVKATTSTSYNASDYSDYALVVLSESLDGSNAGTDNHELKVIVGLDKPILNLKTYFYGANDDASKRWEWGAPNAGKKPKCIYVKNSKYANLTSHPIYSGLTPDGSDSIQILKTPKTTKPIQPIGSFASGKEGYTLALVPNKSTGSGTAIHELTAAQRSIATGDATGETITSKYLMISIQAGELSNLSDGGKKLIKNAANYLVTGSQWVPQYTITYDKGSVDGASGDSFTGTKTHGTSFSLSSSTSAFTRSGYTYDGWSTSADGSTKDYNLGGSYTTDAAITLYPHWVSSAYAITNADPDNGTIAITDGSSDITEAAEDATVNISATGDTGYDFTSWTIINTSTEADVTATLLGDNSETASTSFTMPSYGVTVNATFTAIDYNLTWDMNGGKVTTAGTGAAVNATGEQSTTLNYGDAITKPVVARDGYKFAGWHDGSSIVTPVSTMPAGDVTYTAQWHQQHTITHNLSKTTTSSGTTAYENENYVATYVADEGYVLPTTVSVWRGVYIITASCTWDQGEGTLTIPGAQITGDITITVRSVRAECSVTYNGNSPTSGSAPTDSKNYRYGDVVTVKGDNGMTRTGYNFRGWLDDDNDIFYQEGQTFIITDNVTLTAVWESTSAGSGCYEWKGDPDSYTAGSFTADDNLVIVADPNNASSTAMGSARISTNPSNRDVTCITINSSDHYITGYLSDGSEITSLSVGASTNHATNEGLIVAVFCADEDFSSGVTVQTATAHCTDTEYSDATFIQEFTPASGTKYFRIYRKINQGVEIGDYTAPSGGVGSQTLRIFHISACSDGGSDANFDVTFDDGTAVTPASHDEWPSSMVGVPDGKKITVEDPITVGYAFLGWYDDEGCSVGHEVDLDDLTVTGDITLYAKWVVNEHTFTGAAGTTAWETDGNWESGTAPNTTYPYSYAQVYIKAPATMATDTKERVGRVDIVNDGSTNTGKLTINSGAMLIVYDRVYRIENLSTKERLATDTVDVYLGSEFGDNYVHHRAGGVNGALVMGKYNGTGVNATVQFASLAWFNSIAYNETDKWAATDINQYIGIPFNELTPNDYDNHDPNYDRTSSMLYSYETWMNNWYPMIGTDKMSPFKGYDILWIRGAQPKFDLKGTLVASENQTINLRSYYDGYIADYNENLLANSWAAPINIAKFEEEDFVNAEATIYIFNAGTGVDYGDIGWTYGKTTLPGQYSSLPIEYVKAYYDEYDGFTTIPSMQSFSILSTDGATHSITLDYKRLVYQGAIDYKKIEPMHAPGRAPKAWSKPMEIKIAVEGTKGLSDMVRILEREDFTEGFDNGWEASKLCGIWEAPSLYAATETGNRAIVAVPDVEGQELVFRAGSVDNVYTISFEYKGTEQIYLYDKETQVYTLIETGATYTFTTNDQNDNNRFVITRHNVPAVTTGVDAQTGESRKDVQKVLINDHVYIIRSGKMYTIDGALVK